MTEAPIAVTGCAGFLGSRTAQLLLDAGHPVIGIDCLLADLYSNAPKERRLASLSTHPGFRFFPRDLRTDRLDEALRDASVVLHFAALPGLALSWTHPELYESNNVVGTRRLLQAMSETDAHLVHASTSSVYGIHALGDESAPIDPSSPYGTTKVAAEGLVREFESAGAIAGATILRYFSVYGPDQRPDMAYARFCEALLSGDELVVNGDGTQSRSNTYVDDAAAAAILAAEQKPSGATMNIAGSEAVPLSEAIEALALTIGVPPRVRYAPDVRGDQRETRGANELARKTLGWQPVVGIQDGLRRQALAAIEEYRSRGRYPRRRRNAISSSTTPTNATTSPM